jgi:TrmH family RNA methyltransferase
MIPRPLTSLQHPLVKRLVKLRENRAFRHEEKSLLITGEAVVRDVAAFLPLKTLISQEPLNLSAQETILASKEVLEKIIDLSTHDLVAAEVALPTPSSLKDAQAIVVLEGLSDPGNVGTILRTALALGIDGAFLTPNTADPFNDKALRAARAAPLFLPLRFGSVEELKELLQKKSVYIADVQGEKLSQIAFKKPLALILGHETKGPSTELKALGKAVTIPMKQTMESLNVASAASILIYQIQQDRL